MATKLYPPNIQGTIPAFAGTTLVVPFSMNRAVSKSEVAGFALKIKTVQGSVVLNDLQADLPHSFKNNTEMKVSFDLSNVALNVGQFYRIQLAYVSNNGSVGYYSTVGVVKYTSRPELEIMGFVSGQINSNVDNYTLKYSQKGQDTSEKMYLSKFKLYSKDNELLKESEEVLHNVSQDTDIAEATEEFALDYALEQDTTYYLQCTVTTINGLVISTPKYRVMEKKSVTHGIY